MKYVTCSIITMIVLWLVFALIASSKHKEGVALPLTALEWNHYQANCGEYQIKIENGITTLPNNNSSLMKYFSIFLPQIVQKLELYDSQMTPIFSDWIRSNKAQRINFLYQNNYYRGQNQRDGYHLILPNEINLSEKQFNTLSDCLEKEALVDFYTDEPNLIPEEKRSLYKITDSNAYQHADLSKISMGIKSLTLLSDDCKQKKEIIFYDGEGPVEISFIGVQEYCANESSDNISGEVKISNISNSPVTISYNSGKSSFLTLRTVQVTEVISEATQEISSPEIAPDDIEISTIELAPNDSLTIKSSSQHLAIIDEAIKKRVHLNGSNLTNNDLTERKFYMNYRLSFEIKNFAHVTRDYLIGITVIHHN